MLTYIFYRTCMLGNIPPFSYDHPLSCEVGLLVLTDKSAHPFQHIWRCVYFIGHIPHSSADVNVRPEWSNDEIESAIWKEMSIMECEGPAEWE